MFKPTIMSALAMGALVSLTACGPRKTAEVKPAAPAGAEPPKLWSIEVMNGDKAVNRTDICADIAIRAAFARPAPEVNGKPCLRGNEPVEKGDTYSARCHVDGDLYRVGSATTGDPERDFTVELAVTRLDRKGPTYEQVRRYRLIGACPEGWNIGDAAAPGASQLVNTMTGQARAMPAAAR